MAKSLVVVFGASIFLYSEHVLANTVIYDPLNPHNTITPIPNADPEPSEYLIDGEITMESAESTPSQDQKDNTNVENTQNNEVQSRESVSSLIADRRAEAGGENRRFLNTRSLSAKNEKSS